MTTLDLAPSALDPRAPQPLDLVMDDLMALDARTLLPVNVDVSSAALVVIGAVPEIEKHRPELVALVGQAMVRPIERLELVARAALQAHARHRAIESGADLAAIVTRVTGHRDLLRAEVRSLIARKLVPPSVVEELTQVHGFKNVSMDVLQLVAALRESWGVLQGRTGLTTRDLREAEAAANQLVSAVGVRDQGARSPSADLRQRAFTLLATTYDHARRLISFLRWKEGDADRIAPSFFHGRKRRRARAAAATLVETAHAATPGMPGGSPFVGDEATNEGSAG